jgi:hypothetical protein
MRDILKLNAEFQARATDEMEQILADRTVVHQILESRGLELGLKRDEELRRIEQWAEQQKALIRELFDAMIAENHADMDRNEALIRRIGGGDTAVQPAAGKPAGKAAAAFARAAE